MVQGLSTLFNSRFGQQPLIVRSPGRINLIGEHTDYNEGFVLPAAIDKAVYVAVQKRTDDLVFLHSAEFSDDFQTDLASLSPTQKNWPNYILGVAHQFLKREVKLGGFNLVLDGNVPIGAGMSSSAAVECAVAVALNHLFDAKIPKLELVRMAQHAEHEFAGVMCGIMDQFASMFGKKDSLIRLDCRSLQYEYIPIPLQDVKVVLFDSGIRHSLASTEYNVRKKECEEGVRLVARNFPAVRSLRDATLNMLDHSIEKESVIYKRCRYVVEENERLLSACQDLQDGNLSAFGKKMFLTHDGLSKGYGVSCEELDFLVDQVRNNPAVLGARMMGGGFGGCMIALLQDQSLNRVVTEVSDAFGRNFGQAIKFYEVQIEDGTSVIPG